MLLAYRILGLLDQLNSEELDRMRPVDRRRFAALCHHWWRLAEKRETPKAGVLADLKDGSRSE